MLELGEFLIVEFEPIKIEISSNILTSGRIQRMADQNTGNVAQMCWLLNFQSESQKYFYIIFMVALVC